MLPLRRDILVYKKHQSQVLGPLRNPPTPSKQPCKCVDEVTHLIKSLIYMKVYETTGTPTTHTGRKPSLEEEKKRK